jgi:2-iminobutanoate/2-iminopropanoate deaminase
MKQQVVTENTKSAHLLSQGIISNGVVFVSGQIHADSELKLVEGSAKDKLDQIMANISEVLAATGTGLDSIVKVTIYVTDMAIMPELNTVYPTYFSDILPAREAVCVKALPLGASIEISVVAEA